MLKRGMQVAIIDAYGKPTGEAYEVIFVEEAGDRLYVELKRPGTQS